MPHALPTKRRALIIGAGASGLAAIQQALEAGLEPVCFEARSTVGGIWQYDEHPGPCEVSFDAGGNAHMRVPGDGEVGVPPAPNPVYNGLRTNVGASWAEWAQLREGWPSKLRTDDVADTRRRRRLSCSTAAVHPSPVPL